MCSEYGRYILIVNQKLQANAVVWVCLLARFQILFLTTCECVILGNLAYPCVVLSSLFCAVPHLPCPPLALLTPLMELYPFSKMTLTCRHQDSKIKNLPQCIQCSERPTPLSLLEDAGHLFLTNPSTPLSGGCQHGCVQCGPSCYTEYTYV